MSSSIAPPGRQTQLVNLAPSSGGERIVSVESGRPRVTFTLPNQPGSRVSALHGLRLRSNIKASFQNDQGVPVTKREDETLVQFPTIAGVHGLIDQLEFATGSNLTISHDTQYGVQTGRLFAATVPKDQAVTHHRLLSKSLCYAVNPHNVKQFGPQQSMVPQFHQRFVSFAEELTSAGIVNLNQVRQAFQQTHFTQNSKTRAMVAVRRRRSCGLALHQRLTFLDNRVVNSRLQFGVNNTDTDIDLSTSNGLNLDFRLLPKEQSLFVPLQKAEDPNVNSGLSISARNQEIASCGISLDTVALQMMILYAGEANTMALPGEVGSSASLQMKSQQPGVYEYAVLRSSSLDAYNNFNRWMMTAYLNAVRNAKIVFVDTPVVRYKKDPAFTGVINTDAWDIGINNQRVSTFNVMKPIDIKLMGLEAMGTLKAVMRMTNTDEELGIYGILYDPLGSGPNLNGNNRPTLSTKLSYNNPRQLLFEGAMNTQTDTSRKNNNLILYGDATVTTVNNFYQASKYELSQNGPWRFETTFYGVGQTVSSDSYVRQGYI